MRQNFVPGDLVTVYWEEYKTTPLECTLVELADYGVTVQSAGWVTAFPWRDISSIGKKVTA